MSKKENEIEREIRLELGRSESVRVFRNSVGQAVVKGRTIRYGLLKGSSDLIGWRKLEITPEMVGSTIAQFVGVEVKTATGRLRPEQKLWLNMVNEAGGKAIVARSPKDAQDLLAESPLEARKDFE